MRILDEPTRTEGCTFYAQTPMELSRSNRSILGAVRRARLFALLAAVLGACQVVPPSADAGTDGATDGTTDGATDGTTDLAALDALPATRDLFPDIDEGDLAPSPDLAAHDDLANPPFPDGKPCVAAADCTGLACDHGLCATNPCLDGTRDGKETGIDCGGGVCPKCGVGKSCGGDGDCLSGQCKAAKCAGGLMLSFAPVALKSPNSCVFGGESVHVGDFNGDQVPDIVTAGGCGLGMDGNEAGASVWLSDGKGGFGPASSVGIVWNQNPHTMLAGCRVVGVGDFDADLKLDAVAFCVYNDNLTAELHLCHGDGLGGLGMSCGALLSPANADGVADWNGDRRLDLDYLGQVFLGDGTGAFVAQNGPALPAYRNPALFTGDLNGDQQLDSVVAEADLGPMGPPPEPISILLGKGDGTFATGRQVPTEGRLLALADVNADGRLDLILYGANGVSTVLGLGDGTFGPAVPSPAVMPNKDWGTMQGAVADFNGDGALDVACVSQALSPPVVALLGGGDGTFQPVEISPGPFSLILPQNPAARGIAAADFNHDGKPDIAVDARHVDGYGNSSAAVFFNISH